MTRENRLYHFFYPIFWFLVALIWHPRVKGRENIPKDGAFLAYANHTSYSDPILMIYAMGRRNKMHVIAKESILKVPVLGKFLFAVGTIPLDRDKNDLQAVKRSLKYLKSGEKLGIFPEGTRVREGSEAALKSGFVRMAERSGAPLLPMYIQKRKLFFRRSNVYIGEPFYVNLGKEKLSSSEFDVLAGVTMQKVWELMP